MSNTNLTSHSRWTRLLHLLIFATVSFQMVASLIEEPHLNPPENFWFEVHEKVGLASLTVLFAYWAWALFRRREKGITSLFPWFSLKRISAVVRDARAHLRTVGSGKIPSAESRPLASSVHGLGLIVATALALTGTLGYFFPSMRFLLNVHEVLVWPMWIYLAGHAVMGTVHELLGEGVIQNMFSWR